MNKVVEEFTTKLAMTVRGFVWIGTFSKPHYRHFVEFMGWQGEIYVKEKGIVSLKDYYKHVLNKGMCIYKDGTMVGPVFKSVHFNSLHREYLKRFTSVENQQNETQSLEDDPCILPGKKAVLESAIKLYREGIFDDEMLKVRVERYVKPEYREHVFNQITKKGA